MAVCRELLCIWAAAAPEVSVKAASFILQESLSSSKSPSLPKIILLQLRVPILPKHDTQSCYPKKSSKMALLIINHIHNQGGINATGSYICQRKPSHLGSEPTVVYHRGHAGRPAGEVGQHHGDQHPGCHAVPLTQRTAVLAQLQPLSLGSAPHSQVGVHHDDGAREKYDTRQAQGVAHICGVGRVADQRRGGEVDLDDAVWKRDWRQEERREAPGEGDQEQRPPPRHQSGVLQRVKHRNVPLQADHGQRVHAGGVDGGVAEGHDVAQSVWPLRVALQDADRQV